MTKSKGKADQATGATEAFDLNDYIFFWIGQLDNLYGRRVTRALRKFKINLTSWRTLALLTRRGALTVSELSLLSAIERSALGRTIDTMEAAALIVRRERADDRRMVDVDITDAGRRVYENVLAVVQEVHRQVTWNVEQADLDQCLATLRKLRGNMTDGSAF